MDSDRLEGKGKQIKGKIREGIANATGNTSQQLKGKAEQVGGKVQEGFGRMKDEVRAEKERMDEHRRRPGDDE